MAIHVNCVVKSLLCDYVRLFIHRRKCSYTCCGKKSLKLCISIVIKLLRVCIQTMARKVHACIVQ